MKNLITCFLLVLLIQAHGQLVEDTTNEAIHFDDAFFMQRAFESENAWTRGVISSTINWNKTSNLWDVNRALKSNNDFSMIRFANGGDLSFYTGATTGNSQYALSTTDLSNYLVLKLLATGDVTVSNSIGIGAAPDDTYRMHVQKPNQHHILLTNTSSNGGNGSIAYHNHIGIVNRLQMTSSGAFNFQTYDGTTYEAKFKILGNGDTEVTGKLGVGSVASTEHTMRIAKSSQKMLDLYQSNSGPASISLTHPEGQISRIQFNKSGAFYFMNYKNGSWNANTRISSDGHMGIATTTSTTYALQVGGKIRSEEVRVEIFNGPDYVFEDDYNLRSLEETEAYIKANKHLPEIPSAKEMEANGVAVGEMNMLLLKKIEELTLHTIEQQKMIEAQGAIIQELQELIKEK